MNIKNLLSHGDISNFLNELPGDIGRRFKAKLLLPFCFFIIGEFFSVLLKSAYTFFAFSIGSLFMVLIWNIQLDKLKRGELYKFEATIEEIEIDEKGLWVFKRSTGKVIFRVIIDNFNEQGHTENRAFFYVSLPNSRHYKVGNKICFYTCKSDVLQKKENDYFISNIYSMEKIIIKDKKTEESAN